MPCVINVRFFFKTQRLFAWVTWVNVAHTFMDNSQTLKLDITVSKVNKT